MNRASVFEWHKRFKEGRESVRDDERCGRSKEVRTPELIGQIKNFTDKDGCLSIETISAQFDVSVGTIHIIIREELKMQKICVKFCPKGAQRRSERKTLSWQQGDGRADQFRSRSSWCSGDLRWKLDLLLWPRDQEKARESKSTHKLLMIPFFWQHWHDLHALGSHWTDSQQEILCWGFKGVQDEITSEEASTLQIRSVTFPAGQCNSIVVIDYLTKVGIETVPHPSYSPDLAPCDFWLFPKLKEKLRGCRYEIIEEMKEAVTKVINTLKQEDFHGAFQNLLERYNKCIAAGGDYF